VRTCGGWPWLVIESCASLVNYAGT
jgi:hypothetical protein